MTHRLRMLAGLVALVASFIVLLADSTNDCETYAPFEARFAYTTDCFDGGSGTVLISVPERSAQEPDPSEVAVTIESGTLGMEAANVYYGGDCSGGDGTGHVSALALAVRPAPNASDKVVCKDWDAGSVEQHLACYTEGDAAVQTCTLTLAAP